MENTTEQNESLSMLSWEKTNKRLANITLYTLVMLYSLEPPLTDYAL